MTIQVAHVLFDHTFRGMPEVHRDNRRRITELVERKQALPGHDSNTEEGGKLCTTCIEVFAKGLPLGNHYHTEDEPFRGRGSGVLYLVPEGGDLANPEVHVLPAAGWEVTVPARTAHTFVFDGEPDVDGVIAVLVSIKNWEFEKGVNTFDAVIIDPRAA